MHWTRDCASVSFEHHWPAPVMRIVSLEHLMQRQWKIQKTAEGVLLLSKRPSPLQETVTFRIDAADIPKWRAALKRLAQRLTSGRSHPVSLTLGLRCMLGCWRRDSRARYFGGVPSRSCHVVGVDERLYLVADLYNW